MPQDKNKNWKEVAQEEIKSKHEIGQLLANEQKKVKELEDQIKILGFDKNYLIDSYNELGEELHKKFNISEKQKNKHKRATKYIKKLVKENKKLKQNRDKWRTWQREEYSAKLVFFNKFKDEQVDHDITKHKHKRATDHIRKLKEENKRPEQEKYLCEECGKCL